jgi:hypothetical protein
MKNRVEKIGAQHVSLMVTSQSVPCPTLALRKPALITPQLPAPPALHDAPFINPAPHLQLPLW